MINKYLRPGTFIWTMLLFTIVLIMDSSSAGFNVKDSYIDVFTLLFVAEIGFYFTSRGAEKITAMNNKVALDKEIIKQQGEQESKPGSSLDSELCSEDIDEDIDNQKD